MTDRPLPPASLCDAESAVWTATVAAMPASHFSGETLPALAEYCRCTVAAEQLAQVVVVARETLLADPMNGDVLEHLRKAAGIRSTEVSVASRLATRLGIVSTRKANARPAATDTDAEGPMPWQDI